jgi:hypothetical protein
MSRLIACMTWRTSLGILGPHHVVRDRTPVSESIPVEHNKSGSALCGWPGATCRHTISHHPSQKPAPLISVLDADFEVWFMKVCRAQLYFDTIC